MLGAPSVLTMPLSGMLVSVVNFGSCRLTLQISILLVRVESVEASIDAIISFMLLPSLGSNTVM